MQNTDKINRQFERRHLKNIKNNQAKINKAYQRAINKIYASLPNVKTKGRFDIERISHLKRLVDNVLAEWHEEFLTIMVNGVHEAWNLSETKLDDILGQYTIGNAISPLIQDALFSRNAEALEAFLDRKSGANGLDLSQRVWNYHNQFRFEIENNLAMGIQEGRSAAQMARDQKQYLVEPDKLFRRVRDFSRKLILSKAAKAYNPGQGVYRSSYKNALRMARTETNMAYRSADNDRYARSKVILGYEVRLSDRHPTFDICDHLKGKYPKDFKFVGWHPQCICFTVPVLPSAAEYDRFEEALLNGKSYDLKGQIKDNPQMEEYINKNIDRIKKYAKKPYWIKDNNLKI
ncbi:hypothetical protein [Sphingobacterium kyonggiense]